MCIRDSPHPVSLEEGKTYTLTLENTKKPGLLIKKIDSQTKKPLQGAVFKITRGDGSVSYTHLYNMFAYVMGR